MRYLPLLVLTLLLIQCASDSISDSYQLSANEVGWKIDGTSFKPKNINASYILQETKNRFSITAVDGSEGVLILLYSENENLRGTYPLNKETGNSIKLNKKSDRGLNVFVTERCKAPKGQVIITAHDTKNKTVSGYFDAMLCASVLRNGGTHIIENGKFEKVKYFETMKK